MLLKSLNSLYTAFMDGWQNISQTNTDAVQPEATSDDAPYAHKTEGKIDKELKDTFPASDPPANY